MTINASDHTTVLMKGHTQMNYQTVHTDELSVCSKSIALIPWPTDVAVMPNADVTLFSGTVVESETVPDKHGFLARELADELTHATGGDWRATRGIAWVGVIYLTIDSDREPQSYTLDIHTDSQGDGAVSIIGGDLDGLRYGVQTLRQMLRQCGGTLPVMQVNDHPQYPVRGYYLDVTRGRVPTLDWLKEWACRLELCKYNQLHLYIEHSFAFQNLSEAWRGLDPLTPEQIMEYDAFCAERGIELVPSVSTFGHLYAVLRTHGMRALGEFPKDADRPFSFIERQEHHTLNILLDESFTLSTSLIDQYLPLFSSKKFNIGADETFDLGKGRSRVEAKRVGVGAMYASYVNRLCDYLTSRGHEPVLWGDVALEHPDALSGINSNATLLNWLYDPDVEDDKVRQMADAGVNQYVCPAVHAWNCMLPLTHDAWRNIERMSTYGMRYGASGFLLTDWGDYGHVNDPRLSIPGMMYGAECSWRHEHGSFIDINRRVGLLAFGDETGQVMRVWDELNQQAAFSWYDVVRFLELDYGDGTLNQDVLATFATIGSEHEHVVSTANTLDEARRLFLTSAKSRLSAVPTRPCAMPRMQRTLTTARGRSVLGIGSDMASVLPRAAAGQDLLDACGWWLAVDAGVIQPDDSARAAMRDPNKLAVDLERWFEGYRIMWRQVSQESEVTRIGSVIWRLSDMLRCVGRKTA